MAWTPRRPTDARRGLPDSLQVIRSQPGIDYSGDLEPVIPEAADLSVELREVWTDGLQAYRKMEFDHHTVAHKERYASAEGVHLNQVECLFSLVNPWLQKFRVLSNQGLEQAAHTFGLIRSLNLAGESVETTIDCLVTGSFRSST